MKLAVFDIVQERGAENVAVEDLVQEVAPKASSLVSDSIRKDLAKEIKIFLQENAEDY